MVGRDRELAALSGALERAETVGASWALVTGEPGIGKTRLLSELCALARAHGTRVLSGRGAELERDVPFGVVVDALDDLLATLSPEALRTLCGAQLPQLSRLFPGLSAAARPQAQIAPTQQDQRYRSYRAVRALLERLSTPAPLVLCLDDLHWADPASLELVSFLLRHPPEARLLLLLAWRPGQTPGLAEALRVRARDLSGTAIELDGLAPEQLGELVGELVEGPLLAALHRESGGNPFYAQALAADDAWRTATATPGAEPPAAGVLPEAVAAAVGREIASLSGQARLLAQGAALLGDQFEPELAARCAEVATELLPAALDELVALGVVHTLPDSRRLAFRHPIVRRAVHDHAGPGWRLAAHARAAAALERRGAATVARAHHVAQSAAVGDLGAAQLLIAAAGEVAASAPASALAWLRAAGAIVPEPPEHDGLRIGLLCGQAQALCLLGELGEAHAAFEGALALMPADDPGRVALSAACAGVEHGLGRFAPARERLQAALARMPEARPRDAATLCLELAVSCLYTLDFKQAIAWARRARRLAGAGEPLLEATAAALLAFTCASAERPEQNVVALRERARAAALLDGLGDGELAVRLDALYYLGWAEQLLEDFEAADRHLGRAIAIAEAGGGSQWLASTLVEQAKVLCWRGRIGEARALAQTAVAMARVSKAELLLLLALTAELAACGAAGEIDGAVAAAEEALALAASLDLGYHAALVRRQLALAALELGDGARFLAEAAALDGDGSGPAVTDGSACRLLGARAEVELSLGHAAAAAELAARTDRLAAALALPASTGFACRARARLLAPGDPERALASAIEAVAQFERAGALVEAARGRQLVGELLTACGRRSEALSELAQAAGALGAYGAERSAQRARLALRRARRAGARSGGRPRKGVAALTRREHEVAELICEGLSNREIAARLLLSENTVETHVGHVLAKLDLSARAGVARALSRAC